jgi:hypothetical protein
MVFMADVSIRDLRNYGGDVVDRVERDERFVVPVAASRSQSRGRSPRTVCWWRSSIRRRVHLPPVDPESLCRDVDGAIDSAL